ncbi:MAG TPA: redoxin domain-containing protein [Pedobacter sp.]|uniref:TlpA family protein disulfide reductase n=1 Tax=Pedobacter sp. TaxID=1411316 RepID=UPI002B926F33|nr:redoxin domain-containing protein [Pedobacter sp.]HMI02364.1 redoxin domain-containing protein [Pedobacter sp.]
MKQILFTLLLSVFATLTYAQGLEPGTEIPNTVFYKTDGKVFSTEQITKGKKSLLMFFDATCEHCQRVATVLSKRTKELGNVNIYLISQDEKVSIDYYISNFAKPLVALKNVTVLRDKDRMFIPLFHPKEYPSLYLFSTNRKLIYYTSKEKEVPKMFPLLK